MDNVAHTLIGVALAKSIERPSLERSERKALFWASVIGSNLPDADSMFANLFLGSGKLVYLAHHRGWTHTLLFAFPLALIACLTGAFLARVQISRAWKLKTLSLGGVVAVLCHVLADFSNDYGVHPFAPWMSQWIYGDFGFIIEPWIWLTLLPLAIGTAERKWASWIWIGFATILLGLIWLGPFVPWQIGIVLSLWFAGGIAVYWHWKTPRLHLSAMVVVMSFFYFASTQARRQVTEQLQSVSAGETFIDLVSTPAPANPFCWRVISVGLSKSNTEYVARTGSFSLIPGLFKPGSCFVRGEGPITAPVTSSSILPTESLVWKNEFRGSTREMHILFSKHCEFQALMKFARVPFWTRVGNRWIAGDLRYDREPGLGFSEIEFGTEADENCLKTLPPWDPPISSKLLKSRT